MYSNSSSDSDDETRFDELVTPTYSSPPRNSNTSSSSSSSSMQPNSSAALSSFTGTRLSVTDVRDLIADTDPSDAGQWEPTSDAAIQQKLERMRLAAERSSMSSGIAADGMIAASRPMSARGRFGAAQVRSPRNPNSPVLRQRDEHQLMRSGNSEPAIETSTSESNADVSLSAYGRTEDIATRPNASRRPVESPRKPLNLSDRRRFLMRPVPKDYGMLQCYVTRERTSLTKLFPKYYMFLEHGGTFLMSARRRKKNRSSNYLLSLDPDDLNRSGSNYFGKLRANFVGKEFTMFDSGVNPKNSAGSNKDVRLQLGCVSFSTNILGSKGPRKLAVCIPKVTSDGTYYPFPQLLDKPSMIEKYKNKDWKNLYIFRNHTPQWNEALKGYVLNFNGRVTKPSVKNFQLVETGESDTIYLQFGRVDDHRFTLDFRYPISPFQAFCIALSSFDMKLACE